MLTLNVPKGNYVLTKPLHLSDVEITFDPGTTVTWKYPVLENGIIMGENVTMVAHDCTFKIEYTGETPIEELPNPNGDGPHVVYMYGSKNIIIVGGIYTGPGDGIYVGGAWYDDRRPSDDINLSSLECRANRRNGCTVSSGRDVMISNCKFNLSKGVAPQQGLDIEPAGPNDWAQVKIFDCYGANNGGDVYMNQFAKLNEHSPMVMVDYFDCKAGFIADKHTMFRVSNMSFNNENRPTGYIRVYNSDKLTVEWLGSDS